jgi:putative effector of murein hydrolase LrgA (UPF0299 family)
MKKHVLAAVLWTYMTWYACNVLGAFAGLALPGALIGLAAGAVVLALPVMRGQATAPATTTQVGTAQIAAEG